LYPPRHLVLYREQILAGRIGVDELPARFDIDTVVLEHAALETPRFLAALARSPSWRPTYLDEAAAVFRWRPAAEIDVERAALQAIHRVSSRSPLPQALLPARRLFPALNLGVFLRAYGRPDLARRLADRLWQEGPALPIATFYAAAAEEAGALGQAVPFLEEAARVLGESQDLHSRLARALFFRAVSAMERGELEQAEGDLERATGLRPLEPGPWVALARIAALQGKGALARERLGRARALPGASALGQAIEADPLLRELR
jgi:tetratricopeptide (TPR) repeat protein